MPNSRIEFAVSATPIAEVGAGENVAVATIGKDIGKTLGGSGSVDVAHTTTGYSNGSPSYATTTGTNKEVTILTNNAEDFVFIKNPGLKSDGTVSTVALDIKIKLTTNPTDTITIAQINVDESIFLPRFPAGQDLIVAVASGSDQLKVEYVTVD